MSENLGQFIKELSKIYDPESMDTFISLYLDRRLDNNFIEKRVKTCRSILKGDELKNFNFTMKNVINISKNNIGNNIAIFGSHKHNFLRYIPLFVKVNNLLVVDSSPYLRPLAMIHDEWESFTLLLISTNHAKIFSVSAGRVENTKKLSADIINKHKKGGWSQARFNRLRRGAIHTFFTEVEEILRKIADKRIILAGPGQAKSRFKDKLSENLKKNIVGIIDIDIDDEAELMKQSKNLISKREEMKSHESVYRLRTEILKDGLATYGIKDTLNAVENGQAELLIIDKNYRPCGWICENCQVLGEGVRKFCPYCRKKTSEVDIVEEILEFAERTDAIIEFTDGEEIENLGHIGAILRFK